MYVPQAVIAALLPSVTADRNRAGGYAGVLFLPAGMLIALTALLVSAFVITGRPREVA